VRDIYTKEVNIGRKKDLEVSEMFWKKRVSNKSGSRYVQNGQEGRLACEVKRSKKLLNNNYI